MKSARTDNSNLEAKISLRRRFLEKYHPRGGAVVDCCCGTRAIWAELGKYATEYTPIDLRFKGSNLSFDAARYFDLHPQADVVDIDTWGSPWPIYFAAVDGNMAQRMTVFLTVGRMHKALAIQNKAALALAGLTFSRPLPNSLSGRLQDYVTRAALAYPLGRGWRVVEARESRTPKARYIAIHFTKEKKS